jgi:hypothetical protein
MKGGKDHPFNPWRRKLRVKKSTDETDPEYRDLLVPAPKRPVWWGKRPGECPELPTKPPGRS